MSAGKIERISKAIINLDNLVQSGVSAKSKKSNADKEKLLLGELRELIVSSDFNNMYKVDRRYAEIYIKAIEVIFKLLDSPDHSLRTYAEDSLDAILRDLLLSFNHFRIVVPLINEISRSGGLRATAAAYARLAQTVQYSKRNRVISYGVHIIGALTSLIKRNEEIIQQAIIQHTGTLFSGIGPRLRDQHTEKAFQLYQQAAENLELGGNSNRAAAIVITQICTYYSSILQKAFVRCAMHIRNANGEQSKTLLVGWLNTLKNIWSLVVANVGLFSEESIKMCVSGVLCCLYSSHSEVKVAVIELLDIIVNNSLPFFSSFNPVNYSSTLLMEKRLGSSGMSTSSLPSAASDYAGSNSLRGSPTNSTHSSFLNLSCNDSGLAYDTALDLPEVFDDEDTASENEDVEEIIDPLMRADLYNDIARAAAEEESSTRISTPTEVGDDNTEAIPTTPPSGICALGANLYTYTSTLLCKLFLLSGLKGLRNDRETRISHKILALNCLTSISQKQDISNAVVVFPDCELKLTEVTRFVLHEDDQLCASAATLMFQLDCVGKKANGNVAACIKICNSVQPIRKRALLQSAIGHQDTLIQMDIFGKMIDLAVREVESTFFLLKITCAEFLASIRWGLVPFKDRDEWQEPAHNAFLELLYSSEAKVADAAVLLLPSLVRNADLSEYAPRFRHVCGEDAVSAYEPIPAVLNLSQEYRFLNENPDHVFEANLEYVLDQLCSAAADDVDGKATIFCRSLEELMKAFPASVYMEVWGCVSRVPSTSSGFLAAILDHCELSFTTPAALCSGLNVISKLFAGHCEGYMMSLVREQTQVDRASLPRLPEPQILERMLLFVLRVINLYYSLVAERKSVLAQTGTTALNRPGLSPLTPRKASPSRLADISRLLGTSVHPTKNTSYLESPTINSIAPYLQGAYANFLETLSLEREQKFTTLLDCAVNCLCSISEMLTFQQLRPMLDEILLYIKVVLEVCPESTSRLLHQMFKVVFGKNAANISLDFVNSLKLKEPTPPTNDNEMYYLQESNDFMMFSALVKRNEYNLNTIHRDLGWMRRDMLVKVHTPKPEEITPALELFEGYVTRLRAIYGCYQSVECKKAILGVMCELCRNGIIYTMADPKKILYDFVMAQAEDPTTGSKEMLMEIAMFHIVLARTNSQKNIVLKSENIVSIAANLLDKANSHNCREILSYLRVVLLEFLFVESKEEHTLYPIFVRRTRDFLSYAPSETIYIWTLYLNAARNHRQRWQSVSLDFFINFCEYIVGESYNVDFHSLATVLSCLSPSIAEKPDSLVKTMERCFNIDEVHSKSFWNRLAILFFYVLNNVEEQVLCFANSEDPRAAFSSRIVSLLEAGFQVVQHNRELEQHVAHLIQIVNSAFKSGAFPSLHANLEHHLVQIDLDDFSWRERQEIASQWTQLISGYKSGTEEIGLIKKRIENDCHLKRMLTLFTKENKKTLNETSGVIRRSHMHVEHALQMFAETIFKDYSTTSERRCYTFVLETDIDINTVIETMQDSTKPTFLLGLCMEMKKYLSMKSVDSQMYERAQERCQDLLDTISDHVKIIENSNLKTHLAVVALTEPLIKDHAIRWKQYSRQEISEILNQICVKEFNSLSWKGLSLIFNSTNVKEIFSSSKFEHLQAFSDLFTSILNKIEDSKINMEAVADLENFQLKANEKVQDGVELDALIRKLFDQVQHFAKYFREKNKVDKDLENFIRVILRHPVLHSLAMVPITALKANWQLRIDIRANGDINVPLVNIHMLSNIDVLHEFAWRINWLGWISRQQFEDYWMSLFGVLSSTPTGSEISAENPMNLTERILASSFSVDSLTNLLLYTLLFPEPGNVVKGDFVVKHREKSDLYYETPDIELLRGIEAKLRHDESPASIFSRNLERDGDTGEYYQLSQLSAFSLWTLTGVVKHPGKLNSSPARISLSEYLLKTTGELDTASSVRALFENYSHWFSRGLANLPLPLLSSTVRSMALLSDLFDESQSYEFLYTQMKAVFRSGILASHVDLGYVIYSLLKSFTVIGIESIERTMTEADMAKQVLSWVEAGLTSPFASVREATFHGINYLLQSMSVDALRPVLQYVGSHIITDIDALLKNSDSVQELSYSKSYFTLLWSAAYLIIEEPMQFNFQSQFSHKLTQWFSRSNQMPFLNSMVTSGIEELIIHSASYISQFLTIVLDCFKEYTTMNTVFTFALRMFVTCVFRDEIDPKKINVSNKFSAHLDELMNIYRRCDLRDAKAIAVCLPSILLRTSTEEHAVSTILDLCMKVSTIANQKYSIAMVYEVFEHLRSHSKKNKLHDISRLVRKRVESFPESMREQSVQLLIAAFPREDISKRFFYFLHCTNTECCAAHYEWILALYQNLNH